MTVSYMIDDYHWFEGKVDILYSCFPIDSRYGELLVSDAIFFYQEKHGWLWGTLKLSDKFDTRIVISLRHKILHPHSHPEYMPTFFVLLFMFTLTFVIDLFKPLRYARAQNITEFYHIRRIKI
jgi:hypothetical protein